MTQGKARAPNPFLEQIPRIAPLVAAAVAFSFFINLLMFASPLYMLQIYDRVVTTRSQSTLIALTAIIAFLLLVYALLEFIRSRVLVRVGIALDDAVAEKAYSAVHRGHVSAPQGNYEFGLRDLDTVREFLTGSGLIALCDAPWFPIFILACFVLHPLFGWVAVVGAVVTLALTLLNERMTKAHLGHATTANMRAARSAQTAFRNAEVMQAMGMVGGLKRQWLAHHDDVLCAQAKASDWSGLIISSTKFFRMFLQSGVLGIGAYLVIHQEISAGAIIAGSIFVGRALQPIEQVVGTWKNFNSAQGAYRRVRDLFAATQDGVERMELPTPRGEIIADNIVATPPGVRRPPVLRGVSFHLAPGEAMAIVGPSASGKSSLARVLVGVWPVVQGALRLDGAELVHWEGAKLGEHIGYLPQDIELFGGTVAQNICRFQDADPRDVIDAAMLAGCHEMIQGLPEGYNTQIGDGGAALSGGQRQRIGLARAVYKTPVLIVLDEPNSNLDAAAEEALLATVRRLKDIKRTVIVVSHIKHVLAAMDKVLVLKDGVVVKFGPIENVLTMPRAAVVPQHASAGGAA